MAQSLAIAAKGMGLDSIILGLPRVAFEDRYDNKWQEKLKFPPGHIYGISVAIGHGDEKFEMKEIDKSKLLFLD